MKDIFIGNKINRVRNIKHQGGYENQSNKPKAHVSFAKLTGIKLILIMYVTIKSCSYNLLFVRHLSNTNENLSIDIIRTIQNTSSSEEKKKKKKKEIQSNKT